MSVCWRNAAFLLVFTAAVSLEFYQAQHIMGRCSCPTTIKNIRGNMSDFQVLEKRPGCDRIELIVTMSSSTNSTTKVCLNTEGRMAKAFLKCWERINKEESRKTECINRRRKAEDRTAEDRTAEDRTAEDRTAEDRTAEDRTAED
uniref:Chemokine interleukin-8-like domain-containing protein n=1 Tax=Gouania willdenowi TaxID=441366 RepID=A0A8C5NE88_GOUWI